MTKNHMKRLTAPKQWAVERKTQTFITRPRPGAHSYTLCVSINTFLKEYVELLSTTKETKWLLKHKDVYVNGRNVYDHKAQVGFLDIIEIPHSGHTYRVSLNQKGQLLPVELEETPNTYFDKVTGKNQVSGGQTQLKTLSGRTLLTDNAQHPLNSSITLKDGDLKDTVEFQTGNHAFIFRGAHTGKKGELTEIDGDLITLDTGEEELQTKKEYVIITGKDEPLIEL